MQSVGSAGDAGDNAPAEPTIGIYNGELTHRRGRGGASTTWSARRRNGSLGSARSASWSRWGKFPSRSSASSLPGPRGSCGELGTQLTESRNHSGWFTSWNGHTLPKHMSTQSSNIGAVRHDPTEWLEVVYAAVISGTAVDGTIILRDGDPVEVVVRIESHVVHIERPIIKWHGHSPIERGVHVASIQLEGLSLTSLKQQLTRAVGAARKRRRATFRSCSRCGQQNPPEWMHDHELCQSCAQEFLNIVY